MTRPAAAISVSWSRTAKFRQAIFGVNEFFDGGVMRQLILRRVDISAALDSLVADPLKTGRTFMSRLWK